MLDVLRDSFIVMPHFFLSRRQSSGLLRLNCTWCWTLKVYECKVLTVLVMRNCGNQSHFCSSLTQCHYFSSDGQISLRRFDIKEPLKQLLLHQPDNSVRLYMLASGTHFTLALFSSTQPPHKHTHFSLFTANVKHVSHTSIC